jgi:hypothetical protein
MDGRKTTMPVKRSSIELLCLTCLVPLGCHEKGPLCRWWIAKQAAKSRPDRPPTYGELMLVYLKKHSPATSRTLADILDAAQSTVCVIAKRLTEQNDRVTRHLDYDPDYKREVWVYVYNRRKATCNA